MDQIVKEITERPVEFLKFMQENRYPVVHESNLFFRDIQFAIAKYVEAKTGKKVGYFQSVEEAAQDVCIAFVKTGMFKKVSNNAYNVNCKEFMLPRPEPAPAKPAAEATPVVA